MHSVSYTLLLCILTSGQGHQMNIRPVHQLIYSFFSVEQCFSQIKLNNIIQSTADTNGLKPLLCQFLTKTLRILWQQQTSSAEGRWQLLHLYCNTKASLTWTWTSWNKDLSMDTAEPGGKAVHFVCGRGKKHKHNYIAHILVIVIPSGTSQND